MPPPTQGWHVARPADATRPATIFAALSRLRFSSLALAVILAGVVTGGGISGSLAVLTSSRAVGSNTFTTAASFDTVAPTASASVIAKSGQYFAGFARQGGTYYVYASATDGGAVPSGIATIRADVSAITTGQTAVALIAGSYTVQGVTYGFRSAVLTATSPLTAGSKSYSLTLADNNGNSRTQAGFALTADNTAPTASDVQAANGGATVGRVEAGDTITYTFSEVVDPESIAAGWTGVSALNVVVRFTNTTTDTYAVWNAANTAQLPLGSVNTNGNYVTTNVTAGASGTPSTMVLNTVNRTIRITLGTISGTVTTDSFSRTEAWTPSSSAFDRAGNAMSTTSANESGAADRDF